MSHKIPKLSQKGNKRITKQEKTAKSKYSPFKEITEDDLPYTSITTLHNYISHALQYFENVEKIVFPLVGLIIWRASNNIKVKVSGKIEAETIFKFQVRGMKDYFLCYNENNRCFEIRERSSDGKLLAKYNK